MPESRESILPEGISDLLDLVKQKEGDDLRLKSSMRLICHWLVPILIGKLTSKIDRGLICAEGKDLVLPLIRKEACEELDRNLVKCSHDPTNSLVLDILTEETWQELVQPSINTEINIDQAKQIHSELPQSQLITFEKFLKTLRKRKIRPMKSDV